MTRFRAAIVAQALGAAVLMSAAPPTGDAQAGPLATMDAPMDAPGISTPAPVPDQSMSEPAPVPDRGTGASVAPSISRPGMGPVAGSQGYTPHSSFSETFDNRFHPAPMLNLSVKLQ